MAVLPNIARTRKRVQDKIRFVIQTRLRPAIEAYNDVLGYDTSLGTPEFAVLYPPSVNVGSNVVGLRGGGRQVIDQYPALAVYSDRASIERDSILQDQTQVITYTVAVADLCDVAGLDAAMQRANDLTAIVIDVLETYVPDSPGVDGHAIYRVDIQDTVSRATEQLGNGQWLVGSYATVVVRVRSAIGYEPQFLNRSISPATPGLFTPASEPVVLSGLPVPVEVGSLAQDDITDITVPATSLAVDFTETGFPFNGVADTAYTILSQRTHKMVMTDKLSVDSGFITINLAGMADPPQTGDVWNILLSHPVVRTFVTYSIRFTITP